jgi:hypothetical protein
VYPTIVGTLSLIVRNSDETKPTKRYDTLTEWYNEVKKTKLNINDPSLFAQIYLSNRVTLESLINFANPLEIDEFVDRRYNSHQLYMYAYRRLIMKHYTIEWSRDHEFLLEWKGNQYKVGYSYIHTKNEGSVIKIFDALTSNTLQDLYCVSKDGRVLLSEFAEDEEMKSVEPVLPAAVNTTTTTTNEITPIPTAAPTQELPAPAAAPTPTPEPSFPIRLEPILPEVSPIIQQLLHQVQTLQAQVNHLQTQVHTQGMAVVSLLQQRRP